MDIEHVRQLILELDIDDPAFENTRFEIAELPPLDGRKTLGCFYPEENLIVISPEANEGVALHELGHCHSFFYYHNLSEGAAESFRKVYQGNHNPYHSSSLPFYAFCATLGAVIGLGLGIR